MKKRILFFASTLLYCTQLFSQSCEGPALLNETFESGIPGNWTILNLDAGIVTTSFQMKGYTGQFQSFNHYGRKCVANTSRFTSAITTDDWLITPAITLGPAPVCLSWMASSTYSGGEQYQVHISTTTPTVAGMNANATLFTQPSENIRWTEYSVDLSAYAGQTVYIGFWYNSNSTIAFYLDNIRVSQPVNRDIRVTSVALNDVVASGSYPIAGTLLNGGLNTINSMNINWRVDNGPVNTTPLSSLSIAPSTVYNYIHNVHWNPSANGVYTLKIWASNLNGQPDQYNGNDTLSRTIFVNDYPRKVLFEEFTNTDCGPCASQNPHLDSILSINSALGKVSAIKYHGWWPGITDPMYVFNPDENRNRIQYYGIIGVPTLQSDGLILPDHCGSYDGAPACLNQNDIDSARAIPSVFQIIITNNISGNYFNGSVTIKALSDISFSSLVLHTVVIEDTISYGTAPGINGETDFYQTMRKMLPDTDGVALSAMTQNQTYTYNFSWPIDISCITSRLRTVAFIQDENTSKVWQSEITNSSMTGISEIAADNNLYLFPNPATNKLIIETPKKSEIQILNIDGQVIKNIISVENITTIDISAFAKGMYIVKVINENGIAVKKFIKE
jgi:thiol-disulfide isomerase/thioredoxin